MSFDHYLVWHVVDTDGCVVGSWVNEARAVEQATGVGGHYELVVNTIAGHGPRDSSLTYAPSLPTEERLVLLRQERGHVTYEHGDWSRWASRIGVPCTAMPAPAEEAAQ